LTGYQVNAPYGSCIVHVSPLAVVVHPVVEKSLRVVGAAVGSGLPE
jgi:hypothetical protein